MKTYEEYLAAALDSPTARISRESRHHDAEILNNPESHSRKEIEAAQLATYQHERLVVAAILRYDD